MDALMNLSGSAIADLQGTSKSLLDKYYESRGFTVVLPPDNQAPTPAPSPAEQGQQPVPAAHI